MKYRWNLGPKCHWEWLDKIWSLFLVSPILRHMQQQHELQKANIVDCIGLQFSWLTSLSLSLLIAIPNAEKEKTFSIIDSFSPEAIMIGTDELALISLLNRPVELSLLFVSLFLVLSLAEILSDFPFNLQLFEIVTWSKLKLTVVGWSHDRSWDLLKMDDFNGIADEISSSISQEILPTLLSFRKKSVIG